MRTAGAILLAGLASCAPSRDWPMFGRDATRNAVSPEQDPPTDGSEERGIAWQAALGDLSFGAPVVSDGLVWVGTNNAAPRDPSRREQASVLMCFRERDGAFLWQRLTPREGKEEWDLGNFGHMPLRCSPLVEGDRLWYVTNRWEVVCLDIGPLKRGAGVARERWSVNLVERLGIQPDAAGRGMGFGVACSIGASHEGKLYVSTGHGRTLRIKQPHRRDAPALVCLDAGSGEVLARETSGIGARTLTANWSSPVTAFDGRRTLVLFGGGDGFLYAFDPSLTEVWRVDCKTKEVQQGIFGTPVVHRGRIYVALGEQDGMGPGNLVCVELASGLSAWSSAGVGLTASTPVVHDGLVFLPDSDGVVHCLDAGTGAPIWRYDIFARVTASPLLVDGTLYVADADGELTMIDVRRLTNLARRLKPPVLVERDHGRVVLIGEGQAAEAAMDRPLLARGFRDAILASPVYANGTLYVPTGRWLHAIRRSEGRIPESVAPKRGFAPDALHVPTPQDVVETMLELASVRASDTVFDLGSGDGRIVITAAKKHGCRAVGYEIDRTLVEQSRAAIRREGVSRLATIEYEDLLKADLGGASVVTLYVGSRLNSLLLPKLRALPPGSRIVSHEYALPGVVPERTVKVRSREDGRERTLHLWTTPLKGEGR